MAANALPNRWRIDEHLGIDPRSRPAIYVRLHEAADLSNVNYWLEILFSAGIATLGLVLNSPAVVIGAMLISPLMGPILATGLALVTADLYLGIKSVSNLLLSVFVAVGFSAALVWALPFHSATSEILGRTQPNLLDLGIAMMSGLAGSIVVCRTAEGGGVTALPGVAIAVALMPPLCTLGFGVGSGFNTTIMGGASLLFLTNLVAISASAFLVFLAVGMGAPDVRERVDRLIKQHAMQDWLYRSLTRTKLGRGIEEVGRLRWRVLMMVVLLALLFVPLRQALQQLTDEAVTRLAARDTIRALVPADNLLSQQTEIGRDHLLIRLVVTSAVDPEKVRHAERDLIRRTRKEVTLSVRKVASEEELAILRERLTAPVPAPILPPAPPTFDSVRAELLPRLDTSLRAVWPADVKLLDYELGFTPSGMLVRAKFRGEKPMDQAAVDILSKVLQSQLGAKEIVLVAENVPPEPVKKVRRKGR